MRNPLQLAEHLTVDSQWTHEAIEAQVNTGKTETIYLKKSVPIFLLYWTAEVAEDGVLRFHSDVYDRDRPVLEALNKAPRARKEIRRGEAE